MTDVPASAQDGAFSDGPPAGDGVLLRIDNVVKHYPVRVGVIIKREVAAVQAVDGVSLEIRRGETLGLVGETGSGKSTLARCVAGLHPVTSGRISFDGQDITNLRSDQIVRRGLAHKHVLTRLRGGGPRIHLQVQFGEAVRGVNGADETLPGG